MITDNALIIFIKNPVLGKVKTRLARTVGAEKALDIYLELSRITRKNALALTETAVKIYIFYSDFIDPTDLWNDARFNKAVQSGDDLGQRMHHAFEAVLQQHRRVCIIGSDCPTLSTDLMQQAFEALNTHDFVVGGSTDGGYYLLGMTQNAAQNEGLRVFKDIEWSTETVLRDTLAHIHQLGQTVYQLPLRTDIDEEADWQAFLDAKI